MKPEKNKSYIAGPKAILWQQFAMIEVDEGKIVSVNEGLEVWMGPLSCCTEVIKMTGFEELS